MEASAPEYNPDAITRPMQKHGGHGSGKKSVAVVDRIKALDEIKHLLTEEEHQRKREDILTDL